jgi:hypothetical protein
LLTKLSIICCLLLIFHSTYSQFLMDMVDTSKEVGKGMFAIYQKFDHIRISGYMQPQFQVASAKGIQSYAGGDFAENVDNRFMLRRGRIRIDYVHFRESGGPSLQFAFQFDGTERGVYIRDFWGRIFENRYKSFGFTMGMFARPISYELNLSSSDRESPERGRMSQILMKTERDLGAMISYEPSQKTHPLHIIKWDIGFFNGQGLPATADFDSKKDLISRLALKPQKISSKLSLGVAVSAFEGGMIQNTPYIFKMGEIAGVKQMLADSSSSNKGKYAPRRYYGADMQLKLKTKAGCTELRLEGLAGTQTATQFSTETPARLLIGNEGYYIRKFNGAYFYLLHNIFSSRHQLVVKYDWYDPNSDVKGKEINDGPSNLTPADIKYSTWGFGYNFYMNPNMKLTLYYDLVKNESTLLPGYLDDVSDNVFTFRMQFRF